MSKGGGRQGYTVGVGGTLVTGCKYSVNLKTRVNGNLILPRRSNIIVRNGMGVNRGIVVQRGAAVNRGRSSDESGCVIVNSGISMNTRAYVVKLGMGVNDGMGVKTVSFVVRRIPSGYACIAEGRSQMVVRWS